MKFKKYIALYVVAICFTMFLSACGSDQNPETLADETPSELTFDEKNDRPKMAPQQDNAKVVRNWDEYTYIVEIEDSAYPVVSKEESEKEEGRPMKVNQKEKSVASKKADNKKDMRSTEVPEKLETDEIDEFNIAVELDEMEVEIDVLAAVESLRLNRPPLFDRSCLQAAYPVKCSNEKIREYLKENLSYPEAAIADNYEGVEVVSFRINKNGELEPGVSIMTENSPCQGCVKAAAAVVSQMPDNWVPALENGKVVSTRINLPIRFEHKGTTSLK